MGTDNNSNNNDNDAQDIGGEKNPKTWFGRLFNKFISWHKRLFGKCKAWYNRKTYNQKFLLIFFTVFALIVTAAVVLLLVDLNSDFRMNWYGFLIGSAIVLCVIAGQFAATKNGIYNDLVFDYGILAIPLALVGARVYFVIFDIIDGNSWTFTKFLGFTEKGFEISGLAVYGGLIGAVIGIILAIFIYRMFAQKPKMKFIYCLDLAFTFIPIGQAIGRWGCFSEGCCYGVLVPEGTPHFLPFSYFVLKTGQWHLPTFFYESVVCALLFVFLFISYLGKRKSFNGFNFSIYCIVYGLCRGVLEIFRADTETLYLVPGVIPVSMFVSFVALLFGIVWIAQYVIRAKRAGKKLMIFVPRDSLSDEYFEFGKTIHAHPHVNYIDGTPLTPAATPVEG